MRIFHRESSSRGKWIVAGLLFILTMTFSLADVNAFTFPSNPGGSQGKNPPPQTTHKQQFDTNRPSRSVTPDRPSAVPEPTTILLMASGLGGMLLTRKRKMA